MTPGTPTIVTAASAAIALGDGVLTDSATVLGRLVPVAGGTVDFRLYGPDDADCSAAPVFESLGVPYPVGGGAVASAAFSPTAAGTYRWVATYRGDANNADVAGGCNEPGETVDVRPPLAQELPATGTTTSGLALAALVLLSLGVLMMRIARRQPSWAL